MQLNCPQNNFGDRALVIDFDKSNGLHIVSDQELFVKDDSTMVEGKK